MLMVCVAAIATLAVTVPLALGALQNVPYVPLGGVQGHQTFPILDTDADQGSCPTPPAAGQTIWHFILTKPDGTSNDLLRAQFTGGVTVPDVGDFDANSNTMHWYVTTEQGLSLLNVSANNTGNAQSNLNLSHVCIGPPDIKDSSIVTAIHDVDHNAAAQFPLGSTVHDSATVSVEDDADIPDGSTAKFYWYDNDECSGNPVASSDDLPVGLDGKVDDALPQGPLHAGQYGYRAAFTSGKTDKVKSSVGECEPLEILQGQLEVVTQIHDASHGNVGGDTHVPLGSVVHDTATVSVKSGDYTGFDIPGAGAVHFKLDSGSGLADVEQDPAADGTATARTVDSAALAAGSYTYTAYVDGNDDYEGADAADEPLTVDKAKLSIITTIHKADHSVVANGSKVTIGTSLHDTATVSGAVAGFDTGAISFTLDGNGIANDPAADGTATARSVAVSSALGDHAFAAGVAGNGNYIGADSDPEPFTVVKPTAWCSPGYWKNASNASWALIGVSKTALFNQTVVPTFYINPSAAKPTLTQVLNGANANTYGGVAGPFGLNAFNAVGAYLTSKIPGYDWTGTASGSCPISNGGVLTPAPTA
jgi:hypothetical protein